MAGTKKAAKPATVSKPSLSSEFVVDSDDSGDTGIEREKKPARAKTAISNSRRTKPTESKSSTLQANLSKKRKLPSSSPAGDGSGDSESGKDSSSEDGTRPSKKRALAVHNRNPTPKPKPATARPVKPLNQSGTSQESNSEAGESSEDSGSGSESGSGKEGNSASSDKTSLQSPEKESPVQNSVPQQPKPTYEPPAGFKSTPISFHPASKLSEILAASNLKGKQIWHITVPGSVPISSIEEVSPQDIGNGASILEYHGAKYGLVTESYIEQRSSRALLLPSSQTSNYQLSKTNIVKTLHLQQLVSLPNRVPEPAFHPDRSASASDSYRRTPRQQPEGLRMRYRPFGASDGSDVEATPEPIAKAAEFRMPAPVKESSPGKKRKRPESDDSSSNVVSAVKPKKRKQTSQATAGAIEDPLDTDAMSNMRSNGVESPTRAPHPETNGIKSKGRLPPNGTETKEERKKRRKEEKKPEKREPPSKPATALPLDVKRTAEIIQPGEVVEGAPVSAIANAVEGTKSLNAIPAPKAKNAKRREKSRKRTETKSKATSSLNSPSHGDDVSRRDDGRDRDRDQDQDEIMQEIEDAQREAEIPTSIPLPGESGNPATGPSEIAQQQRQMRKEEKAKRKRKEEKRRRMDDGRS